MISPPGRRPGLLVEPSPRERSVTWFVLVYLVGFLVDVLTGPRRSADEKDMQILLLQHQLRLLQRERPQPPRLPRWEKLTLAVLTAKLVGLTCPGWLVHPPP